MKKYPLVCIEQQNNTWVVNAQDSSLPVTVHSGTKDECKKWANENANEVIYV